MFKFKEYKYKKFSVSILLIVITLGALGMFLINRLQDSDENQFMRQVMGYALFTIMALVISLIDYHFIARLFIPLYLFSLGLLLICKFSNSYPVYGWSHYDARRWIKIGGDPNAGAANGGFEFQPSEITKIVMIIFIAKLFELCYKHIKKLWVFLLAAVLMAIPTFLIFIQTDFSTSCVLLLTFAAMVLVGGISYKIILPIVAASIPVLLALFWYVQQDFQVLLADYQQVRILSMLHPEDYPDLMYQQANAATAIRSGGIAGKLLTGDTGIRGTTYVPVVESDFIFSAIAEEFGFIGSLIVILLFAILIFNIIRIAKRAKDYLGSMIALGIGSLLMFQIFFNIGVVTSLLPNTGIPLPFVSSGLSSLLSSMAMIGVVLNISMQPREAPANENGFSVANNKSSGGLLI